MSFTLLKSIAMDLIREIFGIEVQELSTLQMLCRAFFVFVTSLFFVRLAGVRMLGKKNVFDQVSLIVMGAILGRAIVSAQQPFFPSLLTVAFLMFLHRLFSFIALKNKKFKKAIEGAPILLIKNGRFLKENMDQVQLSEKDVISSLRETLQRETIDEIELCFLEVSGKITFVVRPDGM